MNSQEKYRILVVDDESINRTVIGAILKQEGYDVIEATDGEQCVQMALAKDPVLILLDIQMPPGEDGFGTIKRLKSYGMTKNIPVIFMTAADDTRLVVNGFNLGAVDFINKRCPKEEVVARVRVHIKQYVTLLALAETQIQMRRQINEAQNTLLVKPEELPDRRFSILYRSLNAAGGDMYDVIPINENLTGYFVCDFAGHSTATGFLTSQMKTLLKQNCIAAFDPVESMIIMNKVLKDTLRPGQYVTADYAVYNTLRKKISVVNMGHPPALFVPLKGPTRFVARDGDILGGFDDVSFSMEEIEVEPGDRLVLYTDGLIEKSGTSVWSSELKRLMAFEELVRYKRLRDVPDILFNLFFSDGRQPDDDVLVLVMEAGERETTRMESDIFLKAFGSDLKKIDGMVEACARYTRKKNRKIDMYGMKVVLHELLVNAVVHGNRKDRRKNVILRIRAGTENVSIVVQDEGDGFDWRQVSAREDCSVTDTCGRGLPLMKLYGYEWKYNEKGNRVEAMKLVDDGADEAAWRNENLTGGKND